LVWAKTFSDEQTILRYRSSEALHKDTNELKIDEGPLAQKRSPGRRKLKKGGKGHMTKKERARRKPFGMMQKIKIGKQLRTTHAGR